ncbi:hypothetical protein A2U01_0111597, partial [Trifolium medium]|nr:hypothetical protein [Trifolium medium]
SDAHMSKGKEPVVSDTAAVNIAVIAPKRKWADKEKSEIVVEEKKKKSDKSSASGVGASEDRTSGNVATL